MISPAISRTQQHPLSCHPTITDKDLDLSSLLRSCFRTEIYSSPPPMSPLRISGIPSSIAMKSLQPGAQHSSCCLRQHAKETSLEIGGSTIRRCFTKATSPHKPSNYTTTLGTTHNLHTVQGAGLSSNWSSSFPYMDHPGLSDTMPGTAQK